MNVYTHGITSDGSTSACGLSTAVSIRDVSMRTASRPSIPISYCRQYNRFSALRYLREVDNNSSKQVQHAFRHVTLAKT